jgi:hypothetical protein
MWYTVEMDQLTIDLPSHAQAFLERLAADRGASIETVARDLIVHFATEAGAPSRLTDAQSAEVDRRLANPRGIAADSEVEAFFAETAGD